MVVNFAAESHVDRSIENPEVFLDTPFNINSPDIFHLKHLLNTDRIRSS